MAELHTGAWKRACDSANDGVTSRPSGGEHFCLRGPLDQPASGLAMTLATTATTESANLRGILALLAGMAILTLNDVTV